MGKYSKQMEDYSKFDFVCTLPHEVQAAIKHELEKAVDAEDLAFAMNSRLIDLEDTIDINLYL